MWSRIELSADAFTFLQLNGEMPMCSPDLTFKSQFCRNRKHCIFHNEIYTQRKTQGCKVNDI